MCDQIGLPDGSQFHVTRVLRTKYGNMADMQQTHFEWRPLDSIIRFQVGKKTKNTTKRETEVFETRRRWQASLYQTRANGAL